MSQRCPLCNVETSSVVYKNVPQFPECDIVQCLNCSHRYTVVHKTIDVDKLYVDEVYKVVENRDSIFDKIIRREYNGVLYQLDQFKTQKGNLLDFGTGKGQFGNLAKKDGWKVKAVETSPDRAAYAREIYGLDVNTNFYSAGSIFNINFEALTLFHVLEHLPQPGILLKQLVTDNVRADGMVIVEVPNISSWQSGIAKENWIHLDVPRHINHFSPEILKKFLTDLHFIPVKTSYFSFHLGVLGMVDSLLKKFGYKKNIIFELKNNKSKVLIAAIGLILPFALVMEFFASRFGKGGIIRVYLFKKEIS